jgi:alpha-mannosidase
MFQSRSGGRPPLELLGLWRCPGPDGVPIAALADPWGQRHRPDWHARGLLIWPRGGLRRTLTLRLSLPDDWRHLSPDLARARLVLRWWADAAELRVDGQSVHRGDLFDTACRWELPPRWWQGEPLALELELRSPLHDDGALILSRVELEPRDPADPLGLLAPVLAELEQLRGGQGGGQAQTGPGAGRVQVVGHAHLDLAWLWPVADTWRAAERTFRSVLALQERFADLHFGHSTPALYAWLEQQRPTLFARIAAVAAAGRWEPLCGPWVETDAVLIGTASLLRQFQEGQHYCRRTFPTWEHNLAWLPDSFGFSAGLPAVAAATGVGWFCTHKLAWNATNPFPHRLFRWRSRCGAEVIAVMTAPIGSDGDPVAIERHRLAWRAASGCDDVLWLPGVGDHGGGPTAEMLEQLALWQGQPAVAPQRHGTVRQFLTDLEPLLPRLPIWRDELYLELHRGCATSRPDQKRHNRTLERLLREAELARALVAGTPAAGSPAAAPAAPLDPPAPRDPALAADPPDWRPLLFQQFHDILPGTSIPEVFAQAEPEWRAARRRARRQRDQALAARPAGASRLADGRECWRVVQLQPLAAQPRTLRLPPGRWTLVDPAGAELPLPQQGAHGGAAWLQLPPIAGAAGLELRRQGAAAAAGIPPAPGAPAGSAAAAVPAGGSPPLAPPIDAPVRLEPAPELGEDRWRLANGLLTAIVGPEGLEQLFDQRGRPQLAAPLAWRRFADRGEFWDAWDIAPDYRQNPLPLTWSGPPRWLERGPLAAQACWQGRCGSSTLRLDVRLLAGSPWLELVVSVDWRQRHELLRFELPLARPAVRWAADTPAGVLERPAAPRTAREAARWEVPALAWLASVGEGAVGAGMAVLLDGPQGVDASPERLGVSLLRGPTWPDPGADNGWQRCRLALLPCPDGWRQAAVPAQARRFREPLWGHPVAAPGQGPAWGKVGPLADDLALVSLREAADGSGDGLLAVQNEGPCRRTVDPGPGWSLVERLDGLGRALPGAEVPHGALKGVSAVDQADPVDARLGPWQLGFWRLRAGAAPRP